MRDELRVALWDAINRVVSASGGDPGNTSVARQKAVVEVERIVAGLALVPAETVTQSAAERAVLEACAGMTLGDDDSYEDPLEPQEVSENCYICTDDQYRIARAELARRAAKGGA